MSTEEKGQRDNQQLIYIVF